MLNNCPRLYLEATYLTERYQEETNQHLSKCHEILTQHKFQALRAQSGPDDDRCRLITTLVPESDLSMSKLFHAVINEAPREEATKVSRTL